MSFEKLIVQAVQLGGKITFFEDQAPSIMVEILRGFQRDFGQRIPVVVLKAQDIKAGKIQTRFEDLNFIFSSQGTILEALNPMLKGQRVLLCDNDMTSPDYFADVVWENFDIISWAQMWISLNESLKFFSASQEFEKAHSSPCLFLDRDDVIVKNIPYNNDPHKVELMNGIDKLISRAHASQYWVAMVTNQSGLGRGRIHWEQYRQVHQRTLQLLAEKGCWLDEAVWATYIEQSPTEPGRLYAGLRKPRPGMFQMVNEKLKVKMRDSIMVGDSASDLIAAYSAGVGNLYLLNSEKFEKEKQALLSYKKTRSDFLYSTIDSFEEVVLRG